MSFWREVAHPLLHIHRSLSWQGSCISCWDTWLPHGRRLDLDPHQQILVALMPGLLSSSATCTLEPEWGLWVHTVTGNAQPWTGNQALLSRVRAEATVMGKTESTGKGRPERAVSWPDDGCPCNTWWRPSLQYLTTVVFLEHKQDWVFLWAQMDFILGHSMSSFDKWRSAAFVTVSSSNSCWNSDNRYVFWVNIISQDSYTTFFTTKCYIILWTKQRLGDAKRLTHLYRDRIWIQVYSPNLIKVYIVLPR